MRVSIVLLALVLTPGSLGAQQETAPTPNVPAAPVLSADRIEATRQQSIADGTVDRLIEGLEIPGGKSALAMLYRTRAETNALIHQRVTEIYQIIEGTGTITTGGRLAAAWRPSDLTRVWAGPSQSGVHEGGESRKVGPKDVIIIPAGTPHRFSQLDGPISYLVYRFEAVSPH